MQFCHGQGRPHFDVRSTFRYLPSYNDNNGGGGGGDGDDNDDNDDDD